MQYSNQRIKSFFLILLLLSLTACVDEVRLPIRQVQPRLVVDGLITDEAPPYPIKLTLSGAYASGGGFPEELIINGAVVTITDNADQTVTLEQDPLQPSYYWVRDLSFRGKPGHRYTLTVVLPDGTVYASAPELLAPVAPLERVDATFRQGMGSFGQPDLYTILIDTKDPATPRRLLSLVNVQLRTPLGRLRPAASAPQRNGGRVQHLLLLGAVLQSVDQRAVRRAHQRQPHQWPVGIQLACLCRWQTVRGGEAVLTHAAGVSVLDAL